MDLSRLNPAQRQAVEQTDGPVMILAGAGSGKTRTLVTRILYLLDELKISPFQILALTFSNKAAREMRERVSTEVQIDIGALKLTTFHSFCANMLRSEANFLGLSRNFTIYDDSETKAVVKAVMARRGISPKDMSPFEIIQYIDTLKNSGHYLGKAIDAHEQFALDDDYYSFFQEYEQELHRANALDFGGLITGVLQLFDKHPEVLERYNQRYRYLMIDEYQDTNRAQFQLMECLSRKYRNICVVGDEDQSIYSWRGADIRNILDFEKLFPNSQLIKLEQNYRSSKNIIEAASHVISRNQMRKGKQMWTDNGEGDEILVVECGSDRQEAEYLAEEISVLHDAGAEYRDMAIFYRTNSQSRLIEDHMRMNRLPYRVVGGVKFYDRKEIKDILAYLRLVVNPQDSLALSRIINVPSRGIGAVSLRKIEELAVQNSISLWQMIEDIVNNSQNYSAVRLSAKVRSSLGDFVSLMNEVRFWDSNSEKPSRICEKIMIETGYWDYIRATADYEAQARIENLEELQSALVQFEEDNQNASLLSFLETVTLDTSGQDEHNDGLISLMTVHGAKGLEFPYVFVTGVEENLFPSFQSIENGDGAIEEERRLFYVAMTRAMEKLYLTYAQGRLLFGQVKFNGFSRFLDEIPERYYSRLRLAQPRTSFQTHQPSVDEHSQLVDYDEPIYEVRTTKRADVSDMPKPKFPKGVSVRHSLYGQGVVLQSEGFGAEEKVTLQFADGSRKKFMVKFAPLTSL